MGGFARNDLKVNALIVVRLLPVLDLHDFRLAHLHRRRGQGGRDVRMADAAEEIKSFCEEVVPQQHGNLVSPLHVDGGDAPTHFRLIDDVVVDQRGDVDELHRLRQPEPRFPGAAPGLRRQTHQRRPDHLASRAQHMPHQLADKRVFGDQLLFQLSMEPRQLVLDRRVDRGQIHARGRGTCQARFV